MTKAATRMAIAGTAMFILLMWGCYSQHKVETVHKVEVAPMHITIDINVKVDRAPGRLFRRSRRGGRQDRDAGSMNGFHS